MHAALEREPADELTANAWVRVLTCASIARRGAYSTMCSRRRRRWRTRMRVQVFDPDGYRVEPYAC
jgi:hypothetical protein